MVSPRQFGKGHILGSVGSTKGHHSAWGWGARLGKAKAQGSWQREVARFASNLRELRVVGKALKAYEKMVTGKVVLVCSDNGTTVA